MKVRIDYAVEVSDEIRGAINAHYGRPGLATHQQVKDWYERFGHPRTTILPGR